MTTFNPRPGPLTLVEDQERPLIWIGGELLDEKAYHVGRFDGAHSRPIWRRVVAALLGAFIAGLLIGRLIVPVQAAAPRSVQTTTPQPGASGAIDLFDAPARAPASTSSGPTGAPRSGMPVKVLEAEASRVDPAPAGRVGAPSSPAADVQPSPATSDIGSAIASGIVAYADRSHGDRYLAIPSGPGILVRICSSINRLCLERISTDAGPDLAMQRAGRIADVSFVDFAWLCRCDPRVVGTMRATIEWIGPGLTPPPTDVEP